MFLVIFGVVNLVKCPDFKLVQLAFGCTIISLLTYLLTYLSTLVVNKRQYKTTHLFAL